MLNTPTSVDSLPRLRRFTASQTQTSSFAYLGHDEEGGDHKTPESKEETVAKKSAGAPQPPEKDKEREVEKVQMTSDMNKPRTPEVLSQPVSEGDALRKGGAQDRKELLEVTLSGLKPPGTQHLELTGDGEDQKMCCGFFFKVT